MISKAKLRILEVAEELFMTRGYEVVKLKDIAEILDIKQPSLYYHFPGGKEEIYVEVVIHALSTLNDELLEVISDHINDLRQDMMEIGRWAQDRMVMSPIVMYRIDMPLLSEDHQQRLGITISTKLFAPIFEMFAAAQRRGELREVDLNTVTGMFLSMLESLSDAINFRSSDKMTIWERSIDVLLHGISRVSSP